MAFPVKVERHSRDPAHLVARSPLRSKGQSRLKTEATKRDDIYLCTFMTGAVTLRRTSSKGYKTPPRCIERKEKTIIPHHVQPMIDTWTCESLRRRTTPPIVLSSSTESVIVSMVSLEAVSSLSRKSAMCKASGNIAACEIKVEAFSWMAYRWRCHSSVLK